MLVGPASTGTYYTPAFAALTQWVGADRVRAITVLTLAAGFASTVFAPLALVAVLGLLAAVAAALAMAADGRTPVQVSTAEPA